MFFPLSSITSMRFLPGEKNFFVLRIKKQDGRQYSAILLYFRQKTKDYSSSS